MKSEKRRYGNIKVYNLEGKLLFKGNLHKANWYLKRGLAEITEQEEDIIKAIKLNFKTKGNGHNSDFFFEDLIERCVVCGEQDLYLLTRHHVIPKCYKQYFPLFFPDPLICIPTNHFGFRDFRNNIYLLFQIIFFPMIAESNLRRKFKIHYKYNYKFW